jgi:hypothetical protein
LGLNSTLKIKRGPGITLSPVNNLKEMIVPEVILNKDLESMCKNVIILPGDLQFKVEIFSRLNQAKPYF